jgi:hypothetical protein
LKAEDIKEEWKRLDVVEIELIIPIFKLWLDIKNVTNQKKFNNNLKLNIMAKGQDAKKSVKKEATKTPKEKKEEKRLKKAAKG